MRFFAGLLALYLLVNPVYAGKGSGSSSYSSGGGRSYSSGSKTSTSFGSKSSTSSNKPSGSYSSGNKSYSAAKTSTPAPKNTTNANNSSKPKSTFDSNAAVAKQHEISKANYVKGTESKPTYKTPAGKEVKIDEKSEPVKKVRSIDNKTYVTRETRGYNTYSPYYSRPAVVYNDPYNSFFWYWLLDRSLEERATWAYHHKADMDEARYRELCGKDARLETRIKELETSNKGVRDSSYVPPGIDADLQYSDDFVNSVYNPTKPLPTNFGKFLFRAFLTLLIIAIISSVVWLVFFKNW